MTIFTLLNKLNGVASTELGDIPKAGTLKTAYLPKSIRAAIAAGHLECTPPLVSTTPAASAIDNEIVSSADAEIDIVDPTTLALAKANDATLARELARTQNDLAAVRAELDAMRQQFA